MTAKPVFAPAAFLQVPHCPQRRGQAPRVSAGQHNAPDGLKGTLGLQHPSLEVLRPRTVVIYAAGSSVLEKNGGATSRPARVREVPHFDARHVGDAPLGSIRLIR